MVQPVSQEPSPAVAEAAERAAAGMSEAELERQTALKYQKLQ